ncbi:MAG: Cytosine deaminase, partial [uncultured Actinomycetospora sp.]
ARRRPRGGPDRSRGGRRPRRRGAVRPRRRAARARPQPPRPGRRPRHARRDRRLPRRRAPPALPRHDDGHDALAVLVLRGAHPPVPHPAPGRRRGRELRRPARVARRAGRRGHRARRPGLRGADGPLRRRAPRGLDRGHRRTGV